MKKKFTMLFAALLAVAGVAKADVTDLPQITTDPANPIYYTIYNTRSGSSNGDRNYENGGLIYYAGDDQGIKDGRAAAAATLEDVYKFYFTGSHEELYIHNAAANGKKLKSATSWTDEGQAWMIAAKTNGLVIGPKGGDLEAAGNTNAGFLNEANFGQGFNSAWHSNDAGSLFAIELVEKQVYPVSNLFYVIECPLFYDKQAEQKGLYVDGTNNVKWSTIDLTNKNFYWVPTVNENGTVQLKNLGTGQWLNGNTTSETAVDATIKPLGNNQFGIKVNNYIVHADGHGEGKNENGSLANWAQIANTASGWRFVQVDDPDTKTIVDIVYNYTYNGDTKYTQTTSVMVGEEFPEFDYSTPWGVQIATTKPEGAVSGATTVTVELVDNNALPFKYADSWANITNWYYMPLHSSNRWYLGYAAGQENIPLDVTTLPADGQDAYLWAFVGNPCDGFKIVNKAAGETMILSSSTTMSGSEGGSTYPLLTPESTLSEGNNTHWLPTASTHATNGFFLAQKGKPNHRMNARDNKLAYWTGGADAGSTFQVTTLADFANYDIADLLADAGKVGYPQASTGTYANLNTINGLSGRATVLDVETAIAAYKKTTDIALPEDGKAYTIANYSLNGKTRYLNYTAGSALSVSEDASAASVFVCKKLSNGVYTLVTSDGKVLTWMHPSEGYKEDDKFNGYSAEYGTSYSGYADWNKITIKKNGSSEVDYGYLRMVARRYSRQNTPNSSFIIKGTTGAWDRAGDSYFFQNSGDYFSSAWIFNEVAHENSEAENFAIAKISAKYTLENKPLGEGVGKYHYVIDGENSYTIDALSNATSADAVNAIAATLTINHLTAAFYRIKTTDGQYLQLNAEQTGFELATEYDKIKTILYLDGENTILSYSCGQYLNNYSSPANVGTEGLSWTISENNDIAGAYALKRNGATADNDFFSYWSGVTNGLNDFNAAWVFEEVEWLPVAVNAEVGYTTFYSPVELELSQGRVKAYTGSVSGDYLNLLPQTVVPANTGVILELQEGADVENGYTFLQVKETTLTGLDNDLAGTFAKTYVTEASYVLAKGSKGVGLYKATMNQQEGTAFLNNGFKAYLPAPAGAQAAMFSFSRGGDEDTTSIDNVQLTIDNVVIYDLAGRRVEKMEKGIYIVNGKKVIK